MTAHIVPRPSVEAAFLNRSDIVGDKMIAQVVTLVGGAPELTGGWIDCLTDAVANTVGVDFDEPAVRRKFQNIGAVQLFRVGVGVIHVGAGAHGDEHVPAIFGEDNVAGPVTS